MASAAAPTRAARPVPPAPAEHRAGERDRGRARIAGDRKRQRAVGGNAQAQVEPVEFKPPHPDVEHRRCERIEAKFAARRRKDRSAGGVAHRQTFEPQTHAPRIVHEIGGAENDGVTVADALLERGLDLVVHADQPKGPSRQQRGQRQPADDEQGCDELHRAETNVRDPAGANPAPARAKARTLRIRRHAAHSGAGASPCRHAISNDQYRSPSVAKPTLSPIFVDSKAPSRLDVWVVCLTRLKPRTRQENVPRRGRVPGRRALVP